MKKLSLLALQFFFLATISGQIINVDTLIKPIGIPHEEFGEYLVQLAWANNPQNKTFHNNIIVGEEELKLAKWNWTDDIALQFNINERNLVRQDDFVNALIPSDRLVPGADPNLDVAVPGVTLFPWYNLTATFKLSTFVNSTKRTEIAKQKLEIKHQELGQQKIRVRTQVLTLYYTYLENIEMLKIRTKAVEDADAGYKYAANLFKLGEVPFEQFNQASANFHRSKETELESKSKVNMTKIGLEMMIGMRLEDARRFHGNSK